MERLYAKFLVCFHGFYPFEQYENMLNDMFAADMDNSFLLELEMFGSDCSAAREAFLRHWNYQVKLNQVAFGKALMESLQEIYRNNYISIEEFGQCSYRLWCSLPEELQEVEPFWTLNYADDCLSWGDEKQTRELYEKAFHWYT